MVAAGVFVPAGLEALHVASPMASSDIWTGVRVTPLEGGTAAVSEHSLTSSAADSLASIAGPSYLCAYYAVTISMTTFLLMTELLCSQLGGNMLGFTMLCAKPYELGRRAHRQEHGTSICTSTDCRAGVTAECRTQLPLRSRLGRPPPG